MPGLLTNAELLSRLVGFDSTSRNSNLPIADFIADYLDRPGIQVDRRPSPDGEKANLLIRVGPEGGDGEGLVLSGHMDVVPADEAGWQTDPFTLTLAEGAYTGRGACDMKGFLALAMNAAASFDPAALTAPLVLLFTYDEEVGTLGARRLAQGWTPLPGMPVQAVIGEPTELRVVRAHKGHLKLRLSFEGVGAHSGYPHLGRNAIEPAGVAIAALRDLRAELEAEHPANGELFPEVPFLALNVAQVRGGTATNVIPDHCEVDIGVRTLPGTDVPAVVQRIRDTIARAAGGDFSLQLTGESPPMLLRDDAPVLRAAGEVAGSSETHSVAYATDAGWFQTIGLECVIFGPGNIAVAHKPNESLPASQFERADGMVRSLIRRFCQA